MTMPMTEKLKAALANAGVAGGVAITGNAAGTTMIHAFGQRDLASGAAMAEDTLFQIASMTKAVVSVAALQLVEQGKLSLDAPIGDLLPDLANPQVITGFGDDGAVQTRPATTPITLKHLLTHTSGLGYDFMSADMIRARGPEGPPPFGAKAGLITPLLFDPGERWEYGISTDWAGQAVEAASGQRLDAYVAEHITGPLGMADTSFFPDEASRARAASLYMRSPEGLASMPMEIGGGEAAEFVSGGGGLYSTAPDYLRFCRMVLNNGTLDGARILSPESMALLTTNQIGEIRAGKCETTMPMMSPAHDVMPGVHTGYTLAFITNPVTGPDGRAPGSLAWAGLANCYYWIDPASDATGILLTQLLPFADTNVLAAFSALERSVYGLG
jgi:methyl acetate hydrolase